MLAAVSYPLAISVFATATHNFKQIEINLILQHEFEIHADLLTYNQRLLSCLALKVLNKSSSKL